jgi:hypothetical protein
MKILTPKTVIAAFDALPPVPNGTTINWQVEYNRLRTSVLGLRQRIASLENPQRTERETERDLTAVRDFIASMNATAGSVSCAAIYNDAWFESDCDTMYAPKLARLLVETYSANEGLIESVFKMWQTRMNAAL